MTWNSPAPMATPGAISTFVSMGWNLRLAALNGSVTRVTDSMIPMDSSSDTSTREVSPMRPTMVASEPLEMLTSSPLPSSQLTRFSSWCSVVPGLMTAIM